MPFVITVAKLLLTTIDKEDNILYQKAEQVLTSSDQQELLSEFEKVASDPGKCDKHYDVTL